MLRIALCDDENTELTITHDMISYWMSDRGVNGQIVSFDASIDLIDSVEDGNSYDMFILDVIMPEYNGIELGQKLRNISDDDHLPIIYITSSTGYAVDSYEVRAFHYLIKPVEQEKLNSVLDNALHKLKAYDNNVFPLRTRNGSFSVHYNDIYYVELTGRLLHFVCRDNTMDSVTIPGSFKEAVAGLCEDERFFLCGASLLVNLEHIKSIDKNEVIFSADNRISIPRTARRTLYSAWLDYCLEGGM